MDVNYNDNWNKALYSGLSKILNPLFDDIEQDYIMHYSFLGKDIWNNFIASYREFNRMMLLGSFAYAANGLMQGDIDTAALGGLGTLLTLDMDDHARRVNFSHLGKRLFNNSL